MCIKNSIYLSSPEVFTVNVLDESGKELFTKKIDDYHNALGWGEGMIRRSPNFSYQVLDTDTKNLLVHCKNVNGEVVELKEDASEEGTLHELEHRELITKMLIEAGKIPTEDAILRIAAEIAQVHEEEDKNYYPKLERLGL